MESSSSKVARVLHRILVPLVFVMGGAMFLAVIAQVVFRYVLNEPLPWSEEFARYMMVWIACVAAAEAYGVGSHVGVKVLVDHLPPNLRKWTGLSVHLIVSGLMGVIVFYGFKLSFLIKGQVSPALEIPMTYAYLSVPVGASLILVQALGIFFHEMRLPPSSARDVCALDES